MWDYEQTVEYAAKMESKMDKLYKESTLPKQPDRKFLDELCVEVIEEYIGGI
jgi:hypothetical protein